MLVNGVWTDKWDPVQKEDEEGRFIRESAVFRGTLSEDDLNEISNLDDIAGGNKNVPKRFQLYVVYICPWASRTLIARSLLGLKNTIDVKIGEPAITDFGWRFAPEGQQTSGSNSIEESGIEYMHELYTKADSNYTGRATVPALWDDKNKTIFNNESADILRIMNEDMRPVHQSKIDLYPIEHREKIYAFNDSIYHRFNNGVYRAGFAQSQQAYSEAMDDIFTCLNELELHFSKNDFAVGSQITESDIRLFVTMVRFDIAYHGLFKTNRQRILDYKNLSTYMDKMLAIPAFSENTKVDHIKQGYYSVKKLNPAGIVPEGPELPWFKYLNL